MPLIGIYTIGRFLCQDSFQGFSFGQCVWEGDYRNFVRGIYTCGIYTSGICQEICIQIKIIVIQSSLILSAFQTTRNKLKFFQLVSDFSFEGRVRLQLCHITIPIKIPSNYIFSASFAPRELQLLDTVPILISENDQQVPVYI